MNNRVQDTRGFYRLADADRTDIEQARLRFDRGTLLLEGCSQLPAEMDDYFVYDPRIDVFRAPAHYYSRIIELLRPRLKTNRAPRYARLNHELALNLEPYPHQREAILQWQLARGRGVVVLPTGAGKTLVGLLALNWAKRDTIILVPTIDLMHQWYALLRAAFPELEIGLIGGGYHEVNALTVSTYDSASRHADRLGNRFGLLIFDEAHHLPSEFYRCIAEFSLAPYRLGLTATPERGDGKHADFPQLIGNTVYQKKPEQLAGDVLAPFQIRTIPVELSFKRA